MSENKAQMIFEGIRTISVVIGAIILFLAVQHPESLLKKSSAEEGQALERAKLALEILKQESPKIRAESFMVLRTVWGDKSDWIKDIECKAVIEAGYLEFAKKADAKANEYEKEISGLGSNKLPGVGPQAARLKHEAQEVVKQRDYYKAQLQFCGIDSAGWEH